MKTLYQSSNMTIPQKKTFYAGCMRPLIYRFGGQGHATLENIGSGDFCHTLEV